MRAWTVFAMVLVAGCKPSLKGWWDLDEWRIERDGADPLVETDAGIVVWQAEGSLADFGSVYHLVRYDYDPVGYTLTPDPDAELVPTSWAFEEWDDDLPVELTWIDGEQYLTLSLELVRHQTRRMELEGASPYAGDASRWTWVLVR